MTVRPFADVALRQILVEKLDVATGNSLGSITIDDGSNTGADSKITLSSGLEDGSVYIAYEAVVPGPTFQAGIAVRNALTGELLWVKPVSEFNGIGSASITSLHAERASQANNPVLVLQDRIDSLENQALAVDLLTGEEIWSRVLQSAFSPLVFVTQRETKERYLAYAGRFASFVHDAETGQLVRQIDFGGRDIRFLDSNGRLDVCITDDPTGTRCFNVRNGEQTLISPLGLSFGQGTDLATERYTFGNGFDFQIAYDLAQNTPIDLASPQDRLGLPSIRMRTSCAPREDDCFVIWGPNSLYHLRVSSAVWTDGFE